MAFDFDYDKLPQDKKDRLKEIVKEANRDHSQQFYPDPHLSENLYSRYGKRFIDIIISIAAIIVSLPINIVIAIVTWFDVGSPIFFQQRRIGKDGKLFTMVKFRNMTNKTDENGVLLRPDQRVTKWGRFVRSTSLDELLNFYNIFKGDMSIIGPRPLPVFYEGKFNSYHELRHFVKPGLDCPLRDPSMIKTWQNRLDNDAWYAQNVSLKTDIHLIFLLVKETFAGKDRKTRGTGVSEGSFIGYFADGTVMDSHHIPEEYQIQIKEC